MSDDLVLCVDDDPAVLSSLRRALRREPYDFVTTIDLADALERLARETVGILIADQRMPAMSGTQLLRVAGERSPQTVRVLLTAHPDAEAITDRRALRLEQIITKPWDEQALRRTLLDLLTEARRRVDPPAPLDPAWNDSRVLRIDCRRVPADEVLARIARRIRRAPTIGPAAAIVLDALPSLNDSVARLLTGMQREAAANGVRVYVVDPSGLVRLFVAETASDGAIVALDDESDAQDLLRWYAKDDGQTEAG
jgi:CheY-like chemotaxis protein